MKTAYKLIYATFLVAAFLSVVGSASAAANYTMEGTLSLSSGSDPLSLNGASFTATVTLNNPNSTSTTSTKSTGTYTGVTSLSLSAGALGPLNCTGAGANMTITDNVTGDDQVQFGACILSISSWSGSIQIEGGAIVTGSSAAVPETDATGGQVAYSVLGNVTIFNVTNATLSATGDNPPNITANPAAFSPTVTVGSVTVQQQVVDLSAASPVSYAVSKTGGAWLTFTPSTGNTSSDVTISANPTGLAAGVYNGSVTIDSGQGTPAVVPVTLTVEAVVQPVLSANPTSLTFNYELGASAPSSQVLNIGATSAAAFTVASSASWLQVTPLSETTPEALTVSINTSGLSAGTLNGSLTITAGTASNSPLVVPVTLNVTAPAPTLSVNPTSLSFDYQLLGAAPASKTFDISSSGANLGYTLSVSDPWLSATANGTTPATVTVSINTGSLTQAGVFVGSVTVTAAGAGNSPKVVPVTVNVAAAPTLQAAPSALSFSHQIGEANPGSQMIAVSASGGAAIPFSVSTSGGGWLSAVGGGTTPNSVTVSVNPAGLIENTYNGSVTITSAQASNSPVVVNVSFTVSSQPTISVSPGELSFAHQIGSSAPPAQLVNLSGFTGGGYTAAASSTGNWLAVTPSAGTSPAQLSVSVNTAGLPAGQLTGSVTITAPGAANSPRVVAVTLTITDTKPLLSVNPVQLLFTHAQGAAAPSPKQFTVTSGGAPVTFSVALSGAPWATLGSTGGTTPRAISVSVNPAGLAPGVYEGTATLTSAAAGNSPLLVPIKLSVTSKPTFTSASIVNAASFVPGLPPAAGGLASVFGLFPGALFDQASSIPLPLSLSDISITLKQDAPAALSDGSGVRQQSVSVVAPLLFVSDQQINFQVPWEIQQGTAEVVVSIGGLTSDPVDVDFDTISPAVFTLDYGPGRAIAFMVDGSLAQPVGSITGLVTRPVRIGEPLIIFANGLGPMTGPPMETGNNSLDENGNYVLRETLEVPKVFVGGREAVVAFSGASPEFVGVYQINLAAVPEGVTPGTAVPLVIQLGEIESRADVTIAVDPAAPALLPED